MSEQTARLQLPYILAAQAQKHVTHNEALREIDNLLFLTFPEAESEVPPSQPANGQSYFTSLQATGAWEGSGGKIATWVDGAWQFQEPVVGMVAYVASRKLSMGFDGTEWAPLGYVPDELELDKLAIGTSISQTDVWAVKGSTADFSALTTGAGGSGDMRVSLNREAGGDVASVIFKTNYVGTAEFGLTGNNDFALKVSDDGLLWRNAMLVDTATGQVHFPSGSAQEQVAAPRTFTPRSLGGRISLFTDRRWVHKPNSYGSQNDSFTGNAGTGATPNPHISWAAMDDMLREGDSVKGFKSLLRGYIASEFESLEWALLFVTGTADGPSWNTNAETTKTTVASGEKTLSGTGWTEFNETFTEFVAPSQGFLVFTARSGDTPTETRYAFFQGILEIYRDNGGGGLTGIREKLSEPRTYYVSPSGSNSNSGLTAGQTFASIQHAVNAALALDAAGNQVTIQIADGTYTENVEISRPMHDGGYLSITGNTASPDLVLIDGGAGTALKIDGTGAVVRTEGIKTQGLIALWARFGALVYVRGKTAYGTCTSRQISADNGAYIEIIGQTSIEGGGLEHIHAKLGSHILMMGTTVTLVDTPNFTSRFALASLAGIVSISNNTYVGSATGSRYTANANGVINVNNEGASVLPGSTAGTTATGGVYG